MQSNTINNFQHPYWERRSACFHRYCVQIIHNNIHNLYTYSYWIHIFLLTLCCFTFCRISTVLYRICRKLTLLFLCYCVLNPILAHLVQGLHSSKSTAEYLQCLLFRKLLLTNDIMLQVLEMLVATILVKLVPN